MPGLVPGFHAVDGRDAIRTTTLSFAPLGALWLD